MTADRLKIEILPVSPETCSVLGNRYKATDAAWRGLDFSRAVIRSQSTLMRSIFGNDAPFDLHLDVPFCHPDDQPEGWDRGGVVDRWCGGSAFERRMVYRVRPLMEPGRRWKRRMVDGVEIERDDTRDPPWVIKVRYA